MPAYEFIAQERNGLAIASLGDLENRRIDLYLNQPGNVTARIDLHSKQARRDILQPGRHELIVRREGVRLETVFQLATGAITPNEQGDLTLELGWLGIQSYLQDLALLPGFTSSGAQNSVAFAMIAEVQARANGDYGIVDGSHTPGQPSATVKIDNEVDVKQAIQNFADRQGFDHRINIDREFTTDWPNRGSDKTKTTGIFRHERNCLITNLPEDASPGAIANDVIARGGNSVEKTASNTASQAIYNRREAIVSLTEETNPAALQSYATQIAALRGSPVQIPEISIDTSHPDFTFGDPWLGDLIRVVGDLGDAPYLRLDDTFRIVAVHIELDNEDFERITLELNPVTL